MLFRSEFFLSQKHSNLICSGCQALWFPLCLAACAPGFHLPLATKQGGPHFPWLPVQVVPTVFVQQALSFSLDLAARQGNSVYWGCSLSLSLRSISSATCYLLCPCSWEPKSMSASDIIHQTHPLKTMTAFKLTPLKPQPVQ